MQVLTKAQRAAIYRVYNRAPLYDGANLPGLIGGATSQPTPDGKQLTYREFRAMVQPGYDCCMVKWCGMWLGIEPDGYVHS